MNIEKFKKQNALIKGFTYSDKVVYKEVHHDLLNLFMSIIQKKYDDGIYNFSTMNIRQELICDKANISRDNIFKKIKDLTSISYNLTKEDKARYKKNGLNVISGHFAFITKILKIKNDNKETIYQIHFNDELFKFLLDKNYCLKHGNYTEIKLAEISVLSSKYQKMIGELLLSNKFKKDFSFDYSYLIKKFNMENKENSYLIKVLKRALPELQRKFMDFKYEFHKKDKKISFNLST